MVTPRETPELPPSFDVTSESLLAEVDSILASSAHLRDVLAKTEPSAATFANFITPLTDDVNRAACRLRILGNLFASISPDPALRKASRQAEIKIAAADAERLLHQDIATRVAAVFERSTADDKLDEQDEHLLSRTYREYMRSGACLSDESQRARLKDALAEVNKLRVAAQKAFTEAKDGMALSRTELAGVPENTLESLQRVEEDAKGGGREDLFWVTYRNDHLTNVARWATSGQTRRNLYVSKQYRFPENIQRLEKMLVLRDEIARLLGYKDHASLRMEEKMARSVEEVTSKLGELNATIRPLAEAELEILLELKKREARATSGDAGLAETEENSKLYVWDWAYYSNKLRKERFSVDHAEVAEYFEAMHTLKGMLKTFENLFGMTFEQITASAWHEDVVVYAVWDSEDQGASFLGHLFVDLFAREGKYRPAHHHLIRPVS